MDGVHTDNPRMLSEGDYPQGQRAGPWGRQGLRLSVPRKLELRLETTAFTFGCPADFRLASSCSWVSLCLEINRIDMIYVKHT